MAAALLAAAVVGAWPLAASAQEHQHEHSMTQQRDQVRAQLVMIQSALLRVETALKRSQEFARELVGRLPAGPEMDEARAGVRRFPAELAAAATRLKRVTDLARAIIRDESKAPERTKPGDTDGAQRGSMASLEERNRAIRGLHTDVEAFAALVSTLLARSRTMLPSDSLPAEARSLADRLQRQLGVIALESEQARRSLESLAAALGSVRE